MMDYPSPTHFPSIISQKNACHVTIYPCYFRLSRVKVRTGIETPYRNRTDIVLALQLHKFGCNHIQNLAFVIIVDLFPNLLLPFRLSHSSL